MKLTILAIVSLIALNLSAFSQSSKSTTLTSFFELAEEYLILADRLNDSEEKAVKIHRAYYCVFWLFEENGVSPGMEDAELSSLIKGYIINYRSQKTKRSDEIVQVLFAFYLSREARESLLTSLKAEKQDYHWLIEQAPQRPER